MAAPQLEEYFQQFTSDQLGQIQVTGILDIKDFHTVNLEIVNVPNPIPNMSVAVHMGKITGTTLAQEIDNFPLAQDTLIHTYRVVGLELAVWVMGAPPNANVDIQAWVFLH